MHKIAIIGGGPVGLFMALMLLRQGRSVTIYDAADAKGTDGRVLALSYATATLLEECSAWPDTSATAIDHVHISHDGFGIDKINATDVNLPHLGFTVRYTDVCDKLKSQVLQFANCDMIASKVSAITSDAHAAKNILIRNDTDEIITADMIIIAEGGKMQLQGIEYKSYDYAQTAIIAQINTPRKHDNIAYERFTANGSFVLLPYAKQYMLVWSQPTEIAHDVSGVHDALLATLEQMPFMERFGAFSVGTQIYSYPLKLQQAQTRVVDNMVLIGNAAQTVHPVSAQGLNLSIRDAVILNNLIIKHGIELLELAKYDDLRKHDAKFVTTFTHGLTKFLEQDSALMRHLLGIGLVGLSNCKIIQNKIVNGLIYGM